MLDLLRRRKSDGSCTEVTSRPLGARQTQNRFTSMKNTPRKSAFTLIELLLLMGIVGVLAAILVPIFDHIRTLANRSVDASNIRQIGQASLIYARQNQDQLPPIGGNGRAGLDNNGKLQEDISTVSLHAIAAALARSGGLNEASVWISGNDKHVSVNATDQTTVLEGTTVKTLTPAFENSGLSYAYIGGLNLDLPSNTPIAFTRGLTKNGGLGQWVEAGNHGVYGRDGGYIVFLGGQVGFYENVGATDETGIFTDYETGDRTNSMAEAVPDWVDQQKFYSDPLGPSGSPTGN